MAAVPAAPAAAGPHNHLGTVILALPSGLNLTAGMALAVLTDPVGGLPALETMVNTLTVGALLAVVPASPNPFDPATPNPAINGNPCEQGALQASH